MRLDIPVCFIVLASVATAAQADDCPSPEVTRQMIRQIPEFEAQIELARKEIAISEEVLFVMDDPVLRNNLKTLRVAERTMRSNLDRLLRDMAALEQHCLRGSGDGEG